MTNRKILLINEKLEEIKQIEEAVKRLNAGFAIQVASDPAEALSLLMGINAGAPENYSKAARTKPEVILMAEDYVSQEGSEFLSVIKKYYSLQNIKVFITGDKTKMPDERFMQSLGLSGFIPKPFELKGIFEGISGENSNTSIPDKSLFALPALVCNEHTLKLVNFLKSKLIFKASLSFSVAKVSVGATALVISGVMVTEVINSKEEKSVHYTETTQNASPPAEIISTSLSPAEAIDTVPIPKVEKKVKKLSPDKNINTLPEELIAEEPPAKTVVAPPTRDLRIIAVEEDEEVSVR